jgi:hypothetical protein
MIKTLKETAFVAIGFILVLSIAVGMAMAMNPATWR